MQVDTNVSEADVGRVKVDQEATFTVDAYPGQMFSGTVTSIRKAPINVQNVITYDAVIGVSNADLRLFPGMTANVKILVNPLRNVLKVPNAALRYHPPTEPAKDVVRVDRNIAALEKSVWVLTESNKPRRVPVVTGETDGMSTVILQGDLKDGDHVIVAALEKVTPDSSRRSVGGVGRGPGF
jgi:HlyD family secretion protein